jgi:hypothetical protein
MLRARKGKKGQTLLEYVFIIIVVIGAMIAVGNYFKRGMQGRWKEAVDGLGDQYDPRVADTDIDFSIESNSDTRIVSYNVVTGGLQTPRVDETSSLGNKRGGMTIGGY